MATFWAMCVPRSGEPTLSDTVLDRLVHHAYRFNLNGDSTRRKKLGLTATGLSEQQEESRVASLRKCSKWLGLGARTPVDCVLAIGGLRSRTLLDRYFP